MINWATVNQIESLTREEMDAIAKSALNARKGEALAMFEMVYLRRREFVESEVGGVLVDKMVAFTKKLQGDFTRYLSLARRIIRNVDIPQEFYEARKQLIERIIARNLAKFNQTKGQS